MATAQDDDTPVLKMESYLKCNICLEELHDPRTLPCLHSFCKCCLKKFVQGQGKIIEKFNCPKCSTEFQLKERQQVEEMTRDNVIGNMLEVPSQQRGRGPTKVTCTDSFERKSPTDSRCNHGCNTYEKYLCSECLTAHEMWPISEDRNVFTTADELPKAENQAEIRVMSKCKKHNETLQYFCETCKQLACVHCVSIEHLPSTEEHLCQPITEKVVERKRELLKSSYNFLNEQLEEGNKALQDIENIERVLADNAKKAKDDIQKHKEDILKLFAQEIDKEAKRLTDEVNDNCNETYESLAKQRADIKRFSRDT